MSIIFTGNHPKAAYAGVKAWFGAEYNKHQEEFSKTFRVEKTDNGYDEYTQMTGFTQAVVKPAGESITYASHSQGWTKRFIQTVHGLGFKTTREEVEDGKYSAVGKSRAASLAFALRQAKETVHGNIFNRAFDTGYTGGDGKAMIVSDHPSKAGDWSNVLSSASTICQQALEDLAIQIQTMTDELGNKINLQQQQLLIPPQLLFKAQRILKSDLQSNTAENATNVLKGFFPQGIMVNHYLTSSTAYFVTSNVPQGLISLQRRPVEFAKDNVFDNQVLSTAATERYDCGWVDPRCIVGTPGV